MKKYNKSKRGGFLNQSAAVTDSHRERQVKKLGKNYPTIDFQVHENFSFDEHPHGATTIGYLVIGNHEIEVTIAECNKIAQTAVEAINLANKKYRLGV